MKPCSAWCRPDEGVHVFASACSSESSVGEYVGQITEIGGEMQCCLPEGTEIVVLAEEIALETDPKLHGCNRWFRVPILSTVQVMA